MGESRSFEGHSSKRVKQCSICNYSCINEIWKVNCQLCKLKLLMANFDCLWYSLKPPHFFWTFQNLDTIWEQLKMQSLQVCHFTCEINISTEIMLKTLGSSLKPMVRHTYANLSMHNTCSHKILIWVQDLHLSLWVLALGLKKEGDNLSFSIKVFSSNTNEIYSLSDMASAGINVSRTTLIH